MDHRELYKSIISNQSTRESKTRALVERRQQQRHDIYAAQRCISEEKDDDADRPVSGPIVANAAAAAAAAVETPLTKQQLYHLKFLAWRQEKRQRQAQQTNGPKRAFTSAVPTNRFVNVKAAATLPQSHRFQPPANLSALTMNVFGAKRQPLNKPIVTRSMAAAAAVAAAATSSAVVQKPLVTKSKSSKAGGVEPKQLPPKPKAIVDVAKARATPRPSSRPLMAAPKLAAPKLVGRPKTTRGARQPTTVGPVATASKRQTTNAAVAAKESPITNDSDTTAVGAPFSIDGSMITSTVQKMHAKRSHTPDPMLDVFSPIETAGPAAVAQAERKSAHKRSLLLQQQQPDAAATNNDAVAATAAEPAVDLNVTPIGDRRDINYVSPYVSTSRGKVSARKERLQRESVYKLDLNQSAEEDPAVRQRREAALYFRQQVDTETERLSARAAAWQAYKTEQADRLQSCYVDLIDVTTGQTRLLLAKKFQQFRELVDQCEAGTGEQPVLAHDLEGFWSMVYMQVENCNTRFERLDALRALDWVEEEAVDKAAASSKMVASRPPEAVMAATMAANKKKAKAKAIVRGGNPFLEQIKKASRQRLLEQKQLQQLADTAAAGAAASTGAAPISARKTPRKSMLASVLCHEAHKAGVSPRITHAPILSASTALNKRTPPKPTVTRSILKTPATKRPAGRGVAFAVTDSSDENGSPASPTTPQQQRAQNRRSGGALKFICTPIVRPSASGDSDAGEDGDESENRTPPQHVRDQIRQQIQRSAQQNRRQSVCVTPQRMVTVVQRAADRYSLLDSPVVDLHRLTLADAPLPSYAPPAGSSRQPQKRLQPKRQK